MRRLRETSQRGGVEEGRLYERGKTREKRIMYKRRDM